MSTNWFVARYESPVNYDKPKDVFIQANSIVEAQDKFFEYLRTTELYSHMWKLNVEITKHEGPVIL